MKGCSVCHSPAILQCKYCFEQAYCSRECANLDLDRHKILCLDAPMKRPREDEEEEKTEDELYVELEDILRLARDETRYWNAEDPDVSLQIRDGLLRQGIALVRVSADMAREIALRCGYNMADAFTLLPDKIKVDLRQGRFDTFSKDWQGHKVEERLIVGKSSGMPNKVYLKSSARAQYTHPLTGTIHRPNVIAAKNNIEMWEILGRYNPNLYPTRWYVSPLKRNPMDRLNVSEDGLKIMEKRSYGPTGLHYDGQMGDTKGREARRVQIIYTTDQGPVRLFVVSQSHTPRVKELINQITGLKTNAAFSTHKDIFAKHPRLSDLLFRYGLCIPHNGLIMFVANVWHYEAVGSAVPNANGLLTVDQGRDTKSLTGASVVFRIYCGIIAVPPGSLIKDMIVFAFLREHGWCMDPFSSPNKQNGLFVNEKSTQSWIGAATNVGAIGEWEQLRTTPIAEMKAYLLDNVSPNRLELYGLQMEDLFIYRQPVVDTSGE